MSKLGRLTLAVILLVSFTLALAVGFYGQWKLLEIAYKENPYMSLPMCGITFKVIQGVQAAFLVVVAVYAYSMAGKILCNRCPLFGGVLTQNRQ